MSTKNLISATVFALFILSATWSRAQDLSYSDNPCVGSSISIVIERGNCTGAKVNSKLDWDVSPTPSSIVYHGTTAFNSITITYNREVFVTVSALIHCTNGPGEGKEASVSFNIKAAVTPSVTVSATKTTICQNEYVQFQAIPSNAGNSPTYSWRRNGAILLSETGTTLNSTSISPPLANGDVVSVVMYASTELCVTTGSNPASSGVTMTLSQPVSTVSITGPTEMCVGTVGTFRVNSKTNVGANPQFHWYINDEEMFNDERGRALGLSIDNTYGTITCTNWQFPANTRVKCVMNPNIQCGSSASSNEVVVTRKNRGTLSAGISLGNQGREFCQGDPITFYASANYPVTSYHWSERGSAVSGNGSSYTSTTIIQEFEEAINKVSVTVQTSETCVYSQTVTYDYPLSNLTIYDTPFVPTVQDLTILYGTSATLTATGIANNETYRWYNPAGQPLFSGLTFSTPTLLQNTIYKVSKYNTVTHCEGGKSTLTVFINQPPQISIETEQTVVLPVHTKILAASISDPDGSIASIIWSQVAGAPATLTNVTTATLTIDKLKKGDYSFKVTATDDKGATTSVTVNVHVIEPSNNLNWIKEEVVQVAGITESGTVSTTPVGNQKQINWNYFDGLGRPLQSVAVQGSPNGHKDIITPVVYDEFGRSAVQYLPYVSVNNNGAYAPAAIADQSSYYQTASFVSHDTPYSKTKFEPSPLNRTLKQGAPGAAWQPTDDAYDRNDNTVKRTYELSVDGDKVYSFKYDFTAGTISVSSDKFFAARTLFANRTYDEKNNVVVEFVDKQGRTICKRVQASATTFAETYYIYDDFGNLVVVLPPEGVEKMKSVVGN